MKKLLKNSCRRKKKLIKLSFCACITAVAVCIGASFVNSVSVRGEMVSLNLDVSESVLRFHIIANSDSKEDQLLKLKVRNEITKVMSKKMSDSGVSTKKEAENYVINNMNEYINIANKVIADEGFGYSASAELTRCWFPVKSYGRFVFPEGDYDAFKMILGNGEGKNWWCVLFPSLCMVDESYQITENDPLASEPTPKAEKPPEKQKFKFRFVEWLKDMW